MPDLVTIDTAGAVDLWKRLAPANAANLLDARDEAQAKEDRKRCRRKEDRDKKDNRTFCALLLFAYSWDDTIGRYRTAGNGQPVNEQAIKQAVNTFSDKAANQMGAIASRLVDGSLGLPEFAATMAQKVNAAHTAAYAAGAGGVARLSGPTLTEAQDAVGFHLAKLDGFIADVRRGGEPGETIVARAKLYGLSLPVTQEAAKAEVFKKIADSGVKVEERNILGDAEHCHTTGKIAGCFEEAAKGWVPFGTLTPIGLRKCLFNCRCSCVRRIVQT